MRFYQRRENHLTALRAKERRLRVQWVPNIMRTDRWFYIKYFVRRHQLHKMDVFHSRIGKAYCYSIIQDAKI